MSELTEYLSGFIKERIDVENCCEILSIAKFFKFTTLHEISSKFVENNFQSVVKSETFLNLDFSILMEIVLSDNLLVIKEEQVFKALILWASADPESRAPHLKQLLAYVRYLICFYL